MRGSVITAVVLMSLPSLAWAQSQTTQTAQYGWRSETQAAKQAVENVRPASIPTVRSKTAAPAAPQMKRTPFLVSFRKPQEPAAKAQSVLDAARETAAPLVDQQPSLSDVGDYTLDPPSAPKVPSEGSPAPTAAANPEPTLSVQSNATKEKEEEFSPYCNPPKRKWCNIGCEKKLFKPHHSGLQIGGWFNVGYHNRPNILVNDRPGEVALHQGWLYFDNAASANTGGWDVGYRADFLYGLDAQNLQAFGNSPSGAPSGWDNSWDNGQFGWALPQLYLHFANYDWDVRVGKFFSPFGYEVIGATGNFFYSHSFTKINSEPFTMTGILGERQITSNRSIILGATVGWDTGFENNDGGNIIVGTRFRPNQYVNLAVTSSLGDSGLRGTGRLTSAVAQVQLTENVSYVLQGNILNLGTNDEFGIVQYMFRDISECLTIGARLEWWKSDQFFTDNRSTYNFTMGANYRANANITLRPEVRFDWGAAAVDPGTPIIGIDAVMTF